MSSNRLESLQPLNSPRRRGPRGAELVPLRSYSQRSCRHLQDIAELLDRLKYPSERTYRRPADDAIAPEIALKVCEATGTSRRRGHVDVLGYDTLHNLALHCASRDTEMFPI